MNKRHLNSSIKNSLNPKNKAYFHCFRQPNCQRILMFAESPSGSRRISEKKGERKLLFPNPNFPLYVSFHRSSYYGFKIV